MGRPLPRELAGVFLSQPDSLGHQSEMLQGSSASLRGLCRLGAAKLRNQVMNFAHRSADGMSAPQISDSYIPSCQIQSLRTGNRIMA
jgi:hypothetical protein